MKQQILSKPILANCLVSFFICGLSLTGSTQTVPAGFSFSTVGSGWVSPVGTAFTRSGTRLFVWEKGGRVYVCDWNSSTQVYTKQATAVLNISEEVGDWRDHGMLGFALDPNFDVNGLIYVLYVVDRHYLMNFGTGSYNPATNLYFAATIGRITRYKTVTNGSNQLVADLATRTILVGETKSTGIPILHESHGIGSLAFASDGTLLASAGDGASYTTTDPGNLSVTYYAQALTDGIIRPAENVGAFRSQLVNSMNGKLLRIDPVTGNGVSSNPFYSAAEPRSPASRVWAMGFRNPFRFTIRPNTGSNNPLTGDIGEIYVGDVGYNTYEELNIVKAPGSNCGWPIFEGLTYLTAYKNASTANLDEPNPLYGTNGCTQQYFNFQNLIKQATADNITTVYNPCNSSAAITGSYPNRYFHRVPSMDWKHGTDSARVKVFNGNILGVAQIGSPESGVIGAKPFRGNCAVAGCWYTSTLFPESFRNTYLGADYGGNWLRKFTITQTDKVEKLDTFATGFTGIISVVENPMDGSVFIVDIGANAVKRLTYGGNQAPVVKINADATFGIAPLPVNFTSNGSFDPEGSALSYSWDFGDGSPLDINASPSHTFTTSNAAPKKFVVKLTVTDNLGIPSTDSIIVSANNTPPNVSITSPVKNSLYKVGADTLYALAATVTDAEHLPAQLSYQWQTILRHNNHEHVEKIDTNRITNTMISRVGCNGDTYYWLIKLTVTDAQGLKAIDSSKIFPNCSGASLPLLLTKFTVTAQSKINVLNWTTESEDKMAYYRPERSNDGIGFTGLTSIKATNTYRSHSYQWKDSINKQGYSFYRLKMVDIDGTFKYSPIVSVYNGKLTGDELRVSPNPFRNNFVIAARFRYPGRTVIRIIDGTGKVVATQIEQARPGSNSFTIDELGDIPAGVYYVEVIQNNEIRKTKLVKAH